ncbi:MAG: GIY-YIG nuclease family protein [Candidatus Poribacteria bacterium]|nr:GIY-YIG nuclease family protein [Candidatus Poribacteria bacterium]
MIEKYHRENGGKSWKVKGKSNLIRYVLQEYEEKHGWTCVDEKRPYSWGLPQESTEPPKDSAADLTLGSGTGAVYVYYFPRDKKHAESEGKSVWACKIGMTENDVETRVKGQMTAAIYEEPEIGLEIRTDSPRCLEKAIHAILELKGQKMNTTGRRNEWFLTSPNEVMIIQILINGI